jgi:tellurite resistance protein TerC
MFNQEVFYFGIFSLAILSILILDLTVIGRKSHILSFKEASIWTLVWVSLALAFYVFIIHYGDRIHGITTMEQLMAVHQKYAPQLKLDPSSFENSLDIYRKNMGMEYLSGYLIEYTLSMDNVFVIMMLLSAFSVSPKYYKQVLFWGILGAIVLRLIFILAGNALIQKFEWTLLVFGGFLIFTGVRLFINRNKDERIEPQNHWLVIYLSKHIRVFPRYVGGYFFVRYNKMFYITPLFIVLIMIEFTDLIFATDSIPAIFAITRDWYLVFFSNIFAIIGLRSLFFLLMRVMNIFHYLNIGIAFLLVFVGFKLLFHGWLEEIGFKSVYSLYVILGTLALCIGLSVLFPKKEKEAPAEI